MHQRFHIFRETAATISTTGIKKFLTNTHISSNAFTYMVYISSYSFTQIGYIIHKANTGSQHGICCVFSHLCTRNIHKDYTEVLKQERLIKLSHHLLGLLTLNTYYHPIRTHKIFDSSPLFQKFGITGYIKGDIYPTFVQFFLNNIFHLLSSANGYGRFCYQNGVLIDILTKLMSHGKYIFQIGTTIFIWRSPYGREDHFHIIQYFSQICCKVQSSIAHVTFQQFIQTGLINRHFTPFQFIDLICVYIHAGHCGTHFGKTSTRHQAHIACANNCYFHILLLIKFLLILCRIKSISHRVNTWKYSPI